MFLLLQIEPRIDPMEWSILAYIGSWNTYYFYKGSFTVRLIHCLASLDSTKEVNLQLNLYAMLNF